MPNVDEFESVFRAATRKVFHIDRPELNRALIVCDLGGDARDGYVSGVRNWLESICGQIEVADVDAWHNVTSLRALITEKSPDLLVSYRGVRTDAWRFGDSLGIHLNTMTRGLKLPTIVTPHPEHKQIVNPIRSIMVLTDHLTGDDRLVNFGMRLGPGEDLELHLVHMENDAAFDRFVEAVSKVPEVDTNVVRETVLNQLLKEPHDYIQHVREMLDAQGISANVQAHIQTGHLVSDYRAILEKANPDLVVFPTLSEDRIALDGAAYSLAVNLTERLIVMV